jgi:hypothetical protein
LTKLKKDATKEKAQGELDAAAADLGEVVSKKRGRPKKNQAPGPAAIAAEIIEELGLEGDGSQVIEGLEDGDDNAVEILQVQLNASQV